MEFQGLTFSFWWRGCASIGYYEELFDVSHAPGPGPDVGSFIQNGSGIERTAIDCKVPCVAFHKAIETLRCCARTPVPAVTMENLGLDILDGYSLRRISLSAWEKEREKSMFCDVIHLSEEVLSRLASHKMWAVALPLAFQRICVGDNIDARVSVSFTEVDNEAGVSRLEFIHDGGGTGFLLPWKFINKDGAGYISTYDRRVSDSICTLIPNESVLRRTLLAEFGMQVVLARVIDFWISVERYEKGTAWYKRLSDE